MKCLYTCLVMAGILAVLPTGGAVAEAATEAPQWEQAFAARIHQAWHTGVPMPQLSVAYPEATLTEAYAVQRLFVAHKLAEDTIGGFKAAGVASLDEPNPLIAVMPGSGIYYGADNVVIELADDPSRHVENEIGYRFSKAVRNPLRTVKELQEHVNAVMAVVEVPGNATQDTEPVTREDLIAWNINAKSMILGDAHDPMAVDVDAIEIAFKRDGEIINTARGDMAAAGQWPTLLKTVNNVVRQGYVIQAGHIITNGALGKIVKAEPGIHRAQYGPLGHIVFEVR